METCCGYGYGLERESLAKRTVSPVTTSRTHIFKGRHERFGHHKSRGAFRNLRPYLWVNHFQGLDFTYKEKTTLPEARDDVCEFVSVASFGVTQKDNSLLRFQVWDY